MYNRKEQNYYKYGRNFNYGSFNLSKMSNTYGSNPAYVLAGGGNTSVKDDTTLYVKGSGTQLATIKAEEFVEMSRARLNEIMKQIILKMMSNVNHCILQMLWQQ